MVEGIKGIWRKVASPWVALGFALGLVLGLFLAWQVWPVRWYDTDPSDLRLQYQKDHIVMASDSLAVTGNTDVAKLRLRELTDEDTSWEQVAGLVERVAAERDASGDNATALRVRRLAQAVGMPQGAQPPFEPPKKRLAAPPRWVLFMLGLLVFLPALAIVVWLWMRYTSARLAGGGDGSVSPASEGLAALSTAERTQERAESWGGLPEIEDEGAEEADAEPEGEDLMEEEPPQYVPGPASRTVSRAPTTMLPNLPPEVDEEREVEIPQRRPMRSVRPAEGPSQAGAALGTFEAGYALGDDDYDCSFSIESPSGEFMGECGVGVAGVLESDDVQHIDAFQIWLFDKGDIRTVSRTLVSEYAYEDERIRVRLSAEDELVVAQQGLTITLETLSLRLTARITDFSYAKDAERPNSYFSHLNVILTAESQAGQGR